MPHHQIQRTQSYQTDRMLQMKKRVILVHYFFLHKS